MKLTVQRLVLTANSTCGTLYINDELDCWTLELPHKDGLPGSCIPAGTYPVILSHSPKFSPDPKFVALCTQLGVPTLMPEVVHILNRSEIRIHWGNYPGDTEGCILLGKSHQIDSIGQSRDTFAEFYIKIVEAVHKGEGLSLTVLDPPKTYV